MRSSEFGGGFKLIIENPRGTNHYLNKYWCIEPKLIDENRRERGDYYKKPTQYWFINFEPKNNFIFEAQTYNKIQRGMMDMKKEDWKKTGAKTLKEARSMIHPDYANRFIREFILEEEFVQDE